MLVSKFIAFAGVVASAAAAATSGSTIVPETPECKDGEPFWLQMESQYNPGAETSEFIIIEAVIIFFFTFIVCGEPVKFTYPGEEIADGKVSNGFAKFDVSQCPLYDDCTELVCYGNGLFVPPGEVGYIATCTLACPSYKLDASYVVNDLCEKDNHGHRELHENPAELYSSETHIDSSEKNNAAVPLCLPGDTKFQICFEYVTGPWWLTGNGIEADGDAAGYVLNDPSPRRKIYMALIKFLFKKFGKEKSGREMMEAWGSTKTQKAMGAAKAMLPAPAPASNATQIDTQSCGGKLEFIISEILRFTFLDPLQDKEHFVHCSDPIGECKYNY